MTDTSGSDLHQPPKIIHDADPVIVSGGAERRHLNSRLISALDGIPALRSTSERHLLREWVEERLSPLDLRDHDRARPFFAELVLKCSLQPGGLTELAASVDLVAGGDPLCADVWRLVEQLDALKLDATLTEAWPRLRQALRRIPLTDVQPVILAITDGRVGVLPAYCDGTWSAFIHLVGQNGPPGTSVPPWMAFLEVIRMRFDQDTGPFTRQLLRTIATRWGCTADLERVLATYDARTPRPAKTGVLTMIVGPSVTDPNAFTLTPVQRWDDAASAPVRGDDVPVTRDRLQAEVERVVLNAEEDWAARSADLRIEFVLPLTLINEPVEWWPKDSQTPPPSTLALYHSVVVRSFERLRKTAWHRVWLRRWERLQEGRTARVLWSLEPRREDHVRRLEAELRSSDDYVALVLSEPPAPDADHVQEIIVALRAGVPLILWHRGGANTAEVQQTVGNLVASLRMVPEAVAQLRREIEGLAPGERESHPGRHLTLLWDNAHRVPRVTSAGDS